MFRSDHTKKGGELFQGILLVEINVPFCDAIVVSTSVVVLFTLLVRVQSARISDVFVLGVRRDESDLTNAYRFPFCAPTYNQGVMTAGEEVAALCRSAYCNWLPVAASSTSTPPSPGPKASPTPIYSVWPTVAGEA